MEANYDDLKLHTSLVDRLQAEESRLEYLVLDEALACPKRISIDLILAHSPSDYALACLQPRPSRLNVKSILRLETCPSGLSCYLVRACAVATEEDWPICERLFPWVLQKWEGCREDGTFSGLAYCLNTMVKLAHKLGNASLKKASLVISTLSAGINACNWLNEISVLGITCLAARMHHIYPMVKHEMSKLLDHVTSIYSASGKCAALELAMEMVLDWLTEGGSHSYSDHHAIYEQLVFLLDHITASNGPIPFSLVWRLTRCLTACNSPFSSNAPLIPLATRAKAAQLLIQIVSHASAARDTCAEAYRALYTALHSLTELFAQDQDSHSLRDCKLLTRSSLADLEEAIMAEELGKPMRDSYNHLSCYSSLRPGSMPTLPTLKEEDLPVELEKASSESKIPVDSPRVSSSGASCLSESSDSFVDESTSSSYESSSSSDSSSDSESETESYPDSESESLCSSCDMEACTFTDVKAIGMANGPTQPTYLNVKVTKLLRSPSQPDCISNLCTSSSSSSLISGSSSSESDEEENFLKPSEALDVAGLPSPLPTPTFGQNCETLQSLAELPEEEVEPIEDEDCGDDAEYESCLLESDDNVPEEIASSPCESDDSSSESETNEEGNNQRLIDLVGPSITIHQLMSLWNCLIPQGIGLGHRAIVAFASGTLREMLKFEPLLNRFIYLGMTPSVSCLYILESLLPNYYGFEGMDAVNWILEQVGKQYANVANGERSSVLGLCSDPDIKLMLKNFAEVTNEAAIDLHENSSKWNAIHACLGSHFKPHVVDSIISLAKLLSPIACDANTLQLLLVTILRVSLSDDVSQLPSAMLSSLQEKLWSEKRIHPKMDKISATQALHLLTRCGLECDSAISLIHSHTLPLSFLQISAIAAVFVYNKIAEATKCKPVSRLFPTRQEVIISLVEVLQYNYVEEMVKGYIPDKTSAGQVFAAWTRISWPLIHNPAPASQ